MSDICFPMNTLSSDFSSQTEEKQVYSIYYLTMDERKEQKEKHRDISLKHRKEPLAIRKCRRNYPFAEGTASIAGKPVVTGDVQVYYSFLPEIFLKDMEKPGKRKRWMQKISYTMELVKTTIGERVTILFSKDLCRIFKRRPELPYELYGILLFQARKNTALKNITLSMPQEHSPLMTDEMLALIEPYLAGTRKVVFIGEETKEAIWIEDYLYNEYGIIMDYGKNPAEHSVWITFGEEEDTPLQTPLGREVYLINYERIWKFLDTIVKSGYNTKVN